MMDTLTLAQTLERRPHYVILILQAMKEFIASTPSLKGTCIGTQCDEILEKAKRDIAAGGR